MEGRHLVITGQVQGIGYRWSMVHAAQRVGATGWVRNRYDGSVEAVVCGTPEVIAQMIAWARQGPPGAQVDHVLVQYTEGDFAAFEQQTSE